MWEREDGGGGDCTSERRFRRIVVWLCHPCACIGRSYRCTEGISLPFKVLPVINEVGRTKLECNINVKSAYSNKLIATNMVVLVPVPEHTATAKILVTAGKAKYDATKKALVRSALHGGRAEGAACGNAASAALHTGGASLPCRRTAAGYRKRQRPAWLGPRRLYALLSVRRTLGSACFAPCAMRLAPLSEMLHAACCTGAESFPASRQSRAGWIFGLPTSQPRFGCPAHLACCWLLVPCTEFTASGSS